VLADHREQIAEQLALLVGEPARDLVERRRDGRLGALRANAGVPAPIGRRRGAVCGV
jgi:hypothetical protein